MAFADRTFSRRTLLHGGRALGLACAGSTMIPSAHVFAAPTVTVRAPQIDRIAHCQATISVLVTLHTTSALRSYTVFGDLLEIDAHEERIEHCGTLAPQATSRLASAQEVLRLTCDAPAADVGLMRGVGPAYNETDDADDVELCARIWIRDLSTRAVLGPWDSPQHVAFTNAWLTETPRVGLRADDLQLPRPGLAPESGASMHSPKQDLLLPPQRCMAEGLIPE